MLLPDPKCRNGSGALDLDSTSLEAPRSKSSFVGNISLTILYPVHRTKESYLCETALSKNPLESFDSEKLEDRELSIQ